MALGCRPGWFAFAATSRPSAALGTILTLHLGRGGGRNLGLLESLNHKPLQRAFDQALDIAQLPALIMTNQ